MDAASEAKLSGVSPALAAAVRQMDARVRAAGGSLRVISGLRSYAQQAALYAARATNRNPVAPPGTSKHEKGLAVDLTWSGVAPSFVGALGESLGLRWGGRFSRPDPGHFELVSGAAVDTTPDASGDNAGDDGAPIGLYMLGAFAFLLTVILIKD